MNDEELRHVAMEYARDIIINANADISADQMIELAEKIYKFIKGPTT